MKKGEGRLHCGMKRNMPKKRGGEKRNMPKHQISCFFVFIYIRTMEFIYAEGISRWIAL